MGHTMGPGRGHETWPTASWAEESEVTEVDTRVPGPRAEAAGSAHGTTPKRPDAEAGPGRSWDAPPRGLEPEAVRERWHATQGAFIDDPERAVREADTLAAEACEAVIAQLNARRSALRSAWEQGEGADTESLRLAMRDYRVFVEDVIGDGV